MLLSSCGYKEEQKGEADSRAASDLFVVQPHAAQSSGSSHHVVEPRIEDGVVGEGQNEFEKPEARGLNEQHR